MTRLWRGSAIRRFVAPPAVAIALSLAGGCEKEGTGPDPPGDAIPPAPVTTLSGFAPDSASIVFSWVAPGDDGTSGRASRYEIRTAPFAIADSNWTEARILPDPPQPRPAGQLERIVLSALPSDSAFYVALRTADEVPNWSAVSNSVLRAGAAPPVPPGGWDFTPGYLIGGAGIWAIASGDTDLYAAGDAYWRYPVRSAVVRWDGARWRTAGVGISGDDAAVFSLSYANGDLYAGGVFALAAWAGAGNIARLDGTRWQPLGTGVNGPVWSLAPFGGGVIAGGEFSEAGGVPARSIARWDGASWSPLGGGLDGPVYAVLVHEGDLFAGGWFSFGGGMPSVAVARLAGAAWEPLGSWFDDAALTLCVYRGELIAGGRFTRAGGVEAAHIARWDGAAWRPLDVGLDGEVLALLERNGELIAAGRRSDFGGTGLPLIARWDGSRWRDLRFPRAGATIRALALWRGELVVAGAVRSGFYSDPLLAILRQGRGVGFRTALGP